MDRLRPHRALAAVIAVLLLALCASACASGASEEPVPTPLPIEVDGRLARSINEAIAIARPNATVQLHAGVYHEEVQIDKPVTLEPAGDGPVWIDPDCDFPNGILISADEVTVRDIGVRRADEATVRLDAADNVTLEGLTLQDWNCSDEEDQFRAGVASWDGGRNLTVRDSHFERRVELGGPDPGYGNAVWIKNSSASVGGGHLIEGNTIVGGFDGIGGEPENEPWGAFRNDTVVQDNTISDCSDDGIQVEGGTERVLVQRNVIRRCLIGIAFAPSLRGPLTILRNVVLEPVARRGQGPAMLKVGHDSVGEVYVYHNSFFAGETEADGMKQTNPGLADIVFRNNAVYASRYVIETGEGLEGLDFDYDALFTTQSDRLAVWDGDVIESFAALRDETGQEDNGLHSGDFAWDADLRLLPGSPLIDRGEVIPGVNDDYAGGAPDIGAFEYDE